MAMCVMGSVVPGSRWLREKTGLRDVNDLSGLSVTSRFLRDQRVVEGDGSCAATRRIHNEFRPGAGLVGNASRRGQHACQRGAGGDRDGARMLHSPEETNRAAGSGM